MNSSLDFMNVQEKCIQYLNERKFISLATALQNEVRSRIVDYVNDGIRIGFITWENTVKMNHLRKNPRVSLSVEALQIEGTAKIVGHPDLPENAAFMDLYKERHPSPYKNFISLQNSILIMVEPALLILMSYEPDHLLLDHLDVLQQKAFRKELSPWKRYT
jgi:uncharacterized pyridoxamine 5'-phosphate oxidase family protein